MKKLLIVTQTVDSNDPILGFFVGWIREFGKQCEEVHVLALNVGTYELPANVTVHCLGKSEGRPKPVWLWRLWRLSITLRHRYDDVFVHMNPIHILCSGLLWRFLNKQVGLWYTHPSVDLKLRVAHFFSNIIFTGSESSFKIKSIKKHVIGQGVDTDYFKLNKASFDYNQIKLIVVGRLSKIKNVTLAIDVLLHLKSRYKVSLIIVGGPVTITDFEYEDYLKTYAKEKNIYEDIVWAGSVPQSDLRGLLADANVFVHTSLTHSADKTLPEAMASGLFVVTSSLAYKDDVPSISFQPVDSGKYFQAIDTFFKMTKEERFKIINRNRRLVIEKHSLTRLVNEILRLY